MFNNQWFLKHQKILLFLLNTPVLMIWFRWVLRVNGRRSAVHSKKILGILPNAIFWKGDTKDEYKAEFRTHHKFGKRLYYAFKPFWYLIHIWDMGFANPFAPFLNLGFDTLTTYPAAGANSPVDGYIFNLTNTSWANARASTGRTPDPTEANQVIVQGEKVSTTWNIGHCVFLFDTSSLTAAATVSAATFSVYSDSTQKDTSEVTNPANLSLVSSNPASNNNLVAGDFDASRWGTTKFATDVLISTFSASSQYSDMAMNASGLAAISQTGITKLGIRPSNDFSDATAPSARSYALGYYADQTGTSQDPKLVITYTKPASGGSFLFNVI